MASAQVQGKLEEQSDPVELANFLFVSYNGMQVVVQTNIDRKVLVKAVRRSVDFLPWL
ncbi:MAG: TetR/AcrR family transcriptional repressor of nem operon [Neolewinella sp.]